MNFNPKLAFVVFLIIVVETFAQYLLNLGAKSNNKKNLIAGMMVYSIVGLVYYFILLKIDEVTIANSVWNAGTAIAVTLLGYIVFKDKIGYTQLLGIVLITGGAFLL